MALRFVGLDIETTGNQPGYKTTQIGVAFGTNDYFESLVMPTEPWEFEPGIEELIGITKRDLWNENAMHGPITPFAVEQRLTKWLLEHEVNMEQHHALIPVGWNVGSFDMPAVRRDFPQVSRCISYRAVDLNSLCFARADTDNQYHKIKDETKDWVRKIMGDWKEHTAGGDAIASLLAFEYLRKL